MQYLNILIVGALVIYLAYQLFTDYQAGVTQNMTLRVVLLFFGLAILVYRISQARKQRNR
jgi:hypothetical protein